MSTLVAVSVCLILAFCAADGTQLGLSLLQLHQESSATVPSETDMITLKALDSDNSGAVSFEEVKLFAKAQGLDERQAAEEFKELDIDGDSQLSAEEISKTLEDSQRDAPAHVAPTPPVVVAPPATAPAVGPPPESASSAMVASSAAPVVEKAGAATTSAASAPSVTQGSVISPSGNDVAKSSSKTFLGIKRGRNAELNQTFEFDKATSEAEEQASRMVAEQFARMAEKVLEQQTEDQEQATALEAYAKELRANATKLSDSVTSLAQEAAHAAATVEIEKSATKVVELEKKSRTAKEEASQLHMEAERALQNALQAKDNMTDAGEDKH